MIKIFLVCTSDRFLRLIEPHLNENNISIAGVCHEPKNAVQQYVEVKADLVVLDANWINHESSGVEILATFLKFDNTIKVIFVTNSYQDKLAERAKGFGAVGYFHRNVTSFKPIIDCITNVYNGEHCVTDN